jgi:beta-galactosidase
MTAPKRYEPICPKFPHMIHGGDYNPDQWLHRPDVLAEDMRLMTLAGVNSASVGIFAWATLEPEEGRFEFGWLDDVMDRLAEAGRIAVLATPSGARPAWLSAKYPDVLRVRPEGLRNRHGRRHNHCPSSPAYREKVGIINRKLAERYKDHPALGLWHISNEYGGECYCDLCAEAFRAWLKARYGDLETLNARWWTAFWSHTYTDWSQVEPPSWVGEGSVHGQNLDWRRFVTAQTIDFYRNEIVPLRELTPDVPVTTNFMGLYEGLNYWEFAREVDAVSWDNYPMWHGPEGDVRLASEVAFVHDIQRSMKGGRPWMLMESVPRATPGQQASKLKRPGMHLLSSLQAVAHGSDTVQYFQWRKGRGGWEKFHGAVVDHAGAETTRVFSDVSEVGAALAKLDEVVGTTVRPEVAVIWDQENRWAIDGMAGLGREVRKYQETAIAHYRPFWSRGIPVDVIDETSALVGYRLVVAPMLYLLRAQVAERLAAFVEGGGTLVMTYWSGIVDEHDLCYLGGWPGGGLREVLAVWDEETDALYPEDRNRLVLNGGNALGLEGEYEVRDLCALIHAEGAAVLGSYGDDFYAGRPALTVNRHGQGEAYYIAARTEERFLDDFYGKLVELTGIRPVLAAPLPAGVTAQVRGDGKHEWVFVMNWETEERAVDVGPEPVKEVLSGETVSGRLVLPHYGVRVLKRPARNG